MKCLFMSKYYIVFFTTMIGMYDMKPGNYWYGKKWYFMKKAQGARPNECPDDLTSFGKRFTNEDHVTDNGLILKCIDWNIFQ